MRVVLEVSQGAQHEHNEVGVQRQAEQLFPVVERLRTVMAINDQRLRWRVLSLAYFVKRATAIGEGAREGLPPTAVNRA